jgi:enoyl-CoA hydratase
MTYESYEALEIERAGRILTINFNRTGTKTALDEGMHEELVRVFVDVDRDEDVDVVILTGSGGSFVAGGDIEWLVGLQDDPERCARAERNDHHIQNAMLDLEKPIIAKVKGRAIGIGCSLALLCDFVYATPASRFADPHVRAGLVAGDGGALLWPQFVGYARAKRYLLTGDSVSAEDAAAMGLITAVVDEDRIDTEVQELAERLVNGSRYAIRWTKASINAGLKQVAHVVCDRAGAYEIVSELMHDHRIALDAAREGRRPDFSRE